MAGLVFGEQGSGVSQYYGVSLNNSAWQKHLFEQVQAVFGEPDSQASQQLRLMSGGTDYNVYWNYVILPSRIFTSRTTSLKMIQLNYQEVYQSFVDYLLGNPGNQITFDVYLSRTRFFSEIVPAGN